MKIEILRENLDKVIGVTSKVSNKNLSLPVLGCVLIVVGGGKAVVRATNLDVSIEATLKAKIIEDGVIAIPALTLAQTISAISDPKITLTTTESGNSLTIQSERGVTSITSVDPAEFPTLSYVKESDLSVSLPSRDFSAALKSVVFAASTSSVKPELASVALSLGKWWLTAAATDSFRLAEVKIPVKVKNTFDTLLIPARNIPDILRVAEGGADVEVRVGENQCTVVSDIGYLTSRTIDGAFPDYQSIIPKDSVASAMCLKEDAVRAFKKVSIFTDSFNQIHLSFKVAEKMFSIRAINASVGEAVDHIPAALEGEDIDINFNTRYIMDALAVIGGDSVNFSSAGAGKPMLITDVPHKGFTYLVMPMNR